MTDAVQALHTWTITARLGHSADSTDVLYKTAGPTIFRTSLAGGTAFITFEADALGWTARVARAAYGALRAADTLPGAELPAITADAFIRLADLPALTGAIDVATTAILDNLIAFPMAELVPGFRAAIMVLVTSVSIVIMVPLMVPVMTADDSPIAAAAGVDCDDGE